LALVGATGVGKTTTTAKMAAWYSLRAGQRVALLSMDCYRIGATDQLRAYAKIMRLPCEIALRKKDLVSALKKHSDKDVIIIDTAGKSPYDDNHINELQEWFAPCADLEPHLVLSATTKKEDLQTMIKSYSAISASSLILTKLDETRAYATLCQQVVASSLPVSYVCTGQRVPEDFMVANKDYLDTLFKNGWNAATAFVQSSTAH
jgi:flagellar biosynthesis protein FlhF